MKALSVRAPWWWYIVHGFKDIENRDWPTRFRGRVLIHAGKWWSGNSIYCDLLDIHSCIVEPGTLPLVPPRLSDLQPFGGCIVGSVEIVDCRAEHNSRWFFGKYGFVLRNAVAFEQPIPCKGALGFFDVDESVMKSIAD